MDETRAKNESVAARESPIVIEEYKECGAAARHYSALRFARLTVFLAATAALFAARFTNPVSGVRSLSISTDILAIVATLAFWMMVHRAYVYWKWCHDRLRALEGAGLGFGLYGQFSRGGAVSTTTALNVVFVAFSAGWFLLLFRDLGSG